MTMSPQQYLAFHGHGTFELSSYGLATAIGPAAIVKVACSMPGALGRGPYPLIMILYLRQHSKTHGGDGKSSFRLQERSLVSASRPLDHLQVPRIPDLPVVPGCSRAVRGATLFSQKLHGQEIFSDIMIPSDRIEESYERKVALAANGTRKQQYGCERSHVASKMSFTSASPGLITEATFKFKFKFLLRHCVLYSSKVVSNFDTCIFFDVLADTGTQETK